MTLLLVCYYREELLCCVMKRGRCVVFGGQGDAGGSGDIDVPPHRYPDDHLLLGEVLSFYLARLLQINRVPPATLARPDHPRWTAAAPQMERAGWGAAPVVVLTPWLPDLVR